LNRSFAVVGLGEGVVAVVVSTPKRDAHWSEAVVLGLGLGGVVFTPKRAKASIVCLFTFSLNFRVNLGIILDEALKPPERLGAAHNLVSLLADVQDNLALAPF